MTVQLRAPEPEATAESHPSQSPRARPWAINVALVLASVGAALALGETLLRLFDLAPSTSVVTATAREFDRIPGVFSPGQRLIDRRLPALPHRVAVNELGFRGTEFPLEKAPGERRVLMIGDSFTYGDFVDDDATLPARLEAHLSALCGPVRIINAGLGGATITEELEILIRALPLRPDLVLLLFSENDVTDLARPVSNWERLARNREAKSRPPLSLVYPVLRRTALWNLGLRVAALRRANHVERKAHAGSPAGADSIRRELRERYRTALIGLRDSTRARGIPLVFASYPSDNSISDNDTEQLDWVTATAKELGITAFNLWAPLKESGLAVDRLYLLPHDGHPSPAGYAVAAAFLAPQIASQPPLRLSCGGGT